jgi:hypothetical protein
MEQTELTSAPPFMRACRFNQSSMIDRVTFDDEASTLCISFGQTGKYVHYDVPGAMFDALCKVASVGTFFNAKVKGHVRCRRDPERRRLGPNA